MPYVKFFQEWLSCFESFQTLFQYEYSARHDKKAIARGELMHGTYNES